MSKHPQKHKRSRSPIDPHKHKVGPSDHQGDHRPDSAKLQNAKPFLIFIESPLYPAGKKRQTSTSNTMNILTLS